jgi:hypothetical protein
MNTMEILSLISIGEQQITFFAVALAAFMIWQDKRRLKRKMQSMDHSNEPSNRPIAIVIGIGNDPLAQVKNFLKDQSMENVEILDYIFPDYLQPRGYPDAMININRLKDDAQKLAASEVLLFYAGPVDLAVHTGASFGNWVPIKVFAFAKDKGTYEHRATLTKETARTASLSDQLARTLDKMK